MFQYACGRATSLRTQQPLRLTVDQFSEYQQHNGFELLRVFDLDIPLANREELVALLGLRSNPKIRRLLGRPSMSWAVGNSWCNEPHFDYWPGIINIKNPTYIHGYWQSEIYFQDISDLIRKDFKFRNNFSELDLGVKKRMTLSPSASVHIRRGDYLTAKFKTVYATCENQYYISAVELLRNIVPNIKLFIFSDEPDWVLAHIAPKLGGEVEIVSHNAGSRSANDMHLMSLADHHVIANSSFSWWGAWLNNSKDKVVIAPKKWFADGRSTPTLVPSTWIRL